MNRLDKDSSGITPKGTGWINNLLTAPPGLFASLLQVSN